MKKSKYESAQDEPGSLVKPRRRFAQTFDGPSVVQRQFKDVQDVNRIVARYRQTGLDPYADRAGRQQFGFATAKSFTEAMFQVAAVQSAFQALPAETRSAFGNEPSKWLESLAGPDQGPEEIVPPEALQAVAAQPEPPKTTEGG